MFLKNVKLQSDGGFLGASVSRGYLVVTGANIWLFMRFAVC